MVTDQHIPEKLTLLAAMLDWGLGHVTRCIPILKEFEKQGFHLIIAGTPTQLKMLQTELPNADFRTLPGYNIRYLTKKSLFFFSIIGQLPHIFKTIIAEEKWVKTTIKNEKIDLIFSDNRPGFYSKTVDSVYMTHQLNIKTGVRLANIIATSLHRYFYNKFVECWIPDSSQHHLSGALSKITKPHQNIRMIGPLSQLQYLSQRKIYQLAIVLSGPEPQRTIFENIILRQLKSFDKPVVFVRGLPQTAASLSGLPENILTVNYATSEQLSKIICQSEYIICRSGYSSIMDLVRTRSKAILVPTPGQGEQEYLARYMDSKSFFPRIVQKNFDIIRSFQTAREFRFKILNDDFNTFSGDIRRLKANLEAKNARHSVNV